MKALAGVKDTMTDDQMIAAIAEAGIPDTRASGRVSLPNHLESDKWKSGLAKCNRERLWWVRRGKAEWRVA